MVLAERNPELLRNGRRSRGPSPNGHASSGSVMGTTNSSSLGTVSGNSNSLSVMGGSCLSAVGGGGTPDTSSDDDNSIKRNGKSKKQSEYEEKIRVGRDYQAICPPLVPEIERKPEILNDRALLVWSPTKEIPDDKLEEFITIAKEKYGYNGEQALGMLFWHKHDLERAVLDLSNFTPFPDEWTVEDKVLFEQAFQFHGKSFHRIRQMLPDKSIASLVKYYYSWKKTRHRQSTMDRQEKAKASKDGSENGSENGSNEDSDNEDKLHGNKAKISSSYKKLLETTIEGISLTEPARQTPRWTNEEVNMVVQGIRKHGKNFQKIAEIIGTKSESIVRNFCAQQRRRYNLDQELEYYEKSIKEAAAKTAALPSIESNAGVSVNAEILSAKKEEVVEQKIVHKKKEGSTEEQEKSLKNNTESNKSTSSNTLIGTETVNNSSQKENIIMEIDSDAESSEPSPKKIALEITNQNYPETSDV